MIAATALRTRPSLAMVDAPFEPSLAERQGAVLDLFGDDACDPLLPSFRAVLVHETSRLFERLVLPAVRPVWAGIDASRFLPKWRGGYELYCGLGLSTIVCSARRPALVGAASRLLRGVGADEAAVVGAARLAIPVVFRLLERERCERVALGAAWILVLDEALDDGMPDLSLADKASTMRRVVRGEVDATASVELQAAAALGRALRQRCRDDVDHRAFDTLLLAADAWIDGELHCVAGTTDPTGCSFRMAGVTGSMDVLLWGVDAYAGDVERDFLYRIAELGQMADDWLDIEKDRAQGRQTPAVTGVWGLDDMARVFARAEALLVSLAEQAGEPDSPFRRLLVRTFRGEVQRMARTLVDNP
jgi:hypothetical protein